MIYLITYDRLTREMIQYEVFNDVAAAQEKKLALELKAHQTGTSTPHEIVLREAGD